ncbi:MAG: hypothetical protein HY828_11830 [Actinobacteria bacterium]|nr:hypothetical protein [Actinomycetota bacterium]
MRRSLLALALVGALLSACGDDRVTSSASTDAASSTAATTGDGAVPEALDFSAPLVSGEQLDFRGYAGETVALWFWAPT